MSDTDERRTELLAMLGRQAETLAASDGWLRWLAIARRMRTYSASNQLLILVQRPNATTVMGYRAWQGLGRQVNKGERGIGILALVVRRVAEDDEQAGEPRRRVVAFKPAYVFDVSQTSGPELPSTELPPVRVPDEGLRDQLVDAARTAGFIVEFVPVREDGARGWFHWPTETIAVVETYPASSQVRTLLHELSHAVDPVVRTPEWVRAERELVAESSAYLAAAGLSVDTSDASAVYAAHWGGNHERLLALAGEVLRVAATVDTLVAHLSLVGSAS